MMRLAEHSSGRPVAEADWAEQTRRVLTRDLLLRAAGAQPAESHALQFRALHLNLPLISDIADGLGIGEDRRSAVEHDALDGLARAMRSFDPHGEEDFADFAVPFIEQEIARHLPLVATTLTS
jgi:hypothetical protein